MRLLISGALINKLKKKLVEQGGVKFCVCNIVARKMWYKIKSGLTLRLEHGPESVPKHTAEPGTWI